MNPPPYYGTGYYSGPYPPPPPQQNMHIQPTYDNLAAAAAVKKKLAIKEVLWSAFMLLTIVILAACLWGWTGRPDENPKQPWWSLSNESRSLANRLAGKFAIICISAASAAAMQRMIQSIMILMTAPSSSKCHHSEGVLANARKIFQTKYGVSKGMAVLSLFCALLSPGLQNLYFYNIEKIPYTQYSSELNSSASYGYTSSELGRSTTAAYETFQVTKNFRYDPNSTFNSSNVFTTTVNKMQNSTSGAVLLVTQVKEACRLHPYSLSTSKRFLDVDMLVAMHSCTTHNMSKTCPEVNYFQCNETFFNLGGSLFNEASAATNDSSDCQSKSTSDFVRIPNTGYPGLMKFSLQEEPVGKTKKSTVRHYICLQPRYKTENGTNNFTENPFYVTCSVEYHSTTGNVTWNVTDKGDCNIKNVELDVKSLNDSTLLTNNEATNRYFDLVWKRLLSPNTLTALELSLQNAYFDIMKPWEKRSPWNDEGQGISVDYFGTAFSAAAIIRSINSNAEDPTNPRQNTSQTPMYRFSWQRKMERLGPEAKSFHQLLGFCIAMAVLTMLLVMVEAFRGYTDWFWSHDAMDTKHNSLASPPMSAPHP